MPAILSDRSKLESTSITGNWELSNSYKKHFIDPVYTATGPKGVLGDDQVVTSQSVCGLANPIGNHFSGLYDAVFIGTGMTEDFWINTLLPHSSMCQINDREFISLETSFTEQCKRYPEVYPLEKLPYFKQKMAVSLSSLLSLHPDKISMQVTYESSIFYTLIKGRLTVYLQHYLEVDDDTDEAIVTI
jgi:hypothetical protein